MLSPSDVSPVLYLVRRSCTSGQAMLVKFWPPWVVLLGPGLAGDKVPGLMQEEGVL